MCNRVPCVWLRCARAPRFFFSGRRRRRPRPFARARARSCSAGALARCTARLRPGAARALTAGAAAPASVASLNLPPNLILGELELELLRAPPAPPRAWGFPTDAAPEVSALFSADAWTAVHGAAAPAPSLHDGETAHLPAQLFDLSPRVDVLHDVVRWQRARWRTGHAATKRKGEIRGSGKKPRPQKGGGTSRRGHKRASNVKGGQKAHGPRPNRDYSFKLNHKVRARGAGRVRAHCTTQRPPLWASS
jgi:hypothetical protein